ncbi:MAG: tRNA 2-selenouridine(34) synthase MnmH [Hyphomonas sp.]|uniref:tRNA 2-selenouridine(34) synthase MnmH n=1 Tax=Hyphomonas sp. TaxID=87 RepID=UPI0034A04127
MPYTLTALTDLLQAPFDEIIDVRSPGEFAGDHVPGAINLPVLDDEERARVGTLYKKESAFLARKIGGALVAKRTGASIEAHLLDKPGSYRPLVYCWRGGMRSGAFATILRQIGWRAETVECGYKSYRRLVVDLLHRPPGEGGVLTGPLVILDGNTGTAKTELLQYLAAQGAQMLDLERLAGHRGSLFGELEPGQPSQKAMESALAMKIVSFDPARPVFVEAESSRIGRLTLPRVLWDNMRRAPRVRIEAELDARGAYLAGAYGDVAADAERLTRTIDRLRPYQAADRITAWHDLAAAGRTEDLAREIAAHHYDPKYARQRARDTQPELGTVRLSDFLAPTLERAAAEIIALTERGAATLRSL